ncbi:hypothetical protein E2I00_014250, partial [Balaenoptera physalus]
PGISGHPHREPRAPLPAVAMGCGASRPRRPGSSGRVKAKAAPESRRMQVAHLRAKFAPRILARYDIKALIGTGSFSKFVRVEQKTTKKPFAIKVIETRMREGREACESEFSILRWLLEIFEAQDQVYMVMELATGGEFFDGLISQGYFTEQDAVRILHMVADGMRCLQRIENNSQAPKARKSLMLSPRCRVKIFYHRFWFGTLWEQKFLPFDGESHMRLYRKILKGKYNYTGDMIHTLFEM